MLLARGAKVDAKNNTGYTPLHSAATRNQESLALLLLVNGADINAKTDEGCTPLYLAEKRGMGEGYTHAASMLRERGGHE